ncbi:hypothetical protein HanIR_Chr07g0331401 [Helianthus annuus]|nr:hypothetical protein HanIR_Chr07g0331401 [Helianthus annuus]
MLSIEQMHPLPYNGQSWITHPHPLISSLYFSLSLYNHHQKTPTPPTTGYHLHHYHKLRHPAPPPSLSMSTSKSMVQSCTRCYPSDLS